MVAHESLVISGGQVWGGRERGFEERDLVIVNGVVADRAAPGSAQIDAAGRWIVPGLSDAHFHAYSSSMNGLEAELGPLSYVALNASRRLESALRRGFTTVRDVAGGDIGLQRAVNDGLFPSPRYLYTGAALSQTGGHGDPRSAHVDVCFTHGHMCEVVDGVDAVRLAVRERLRTGAHAIKVMTSGGVFTLTDPLPIPQYSAEELRAISDEAARRGSYVTAHAYSSEAVMHSIENGIRCIEHGNLIDRSAADEMARRGAYLVPTLVTYDAMGRRGAQLGLNEVSLAKNAQVLSSGKDAAAMALEAGVHLGFGTDLMGDLEDEQLRGIQLQVEAIGVVEALHSMTVGNAEIFGDAALGHLGLSAYGDALLLSANPLEEPSAFWEHGEHKQVVQGGRLID